MTDFADDARVDLRFGTDGDRNLYLLAKANGKVWKVVGTKNEPVTSEVEPSIQDDLVAYYDFEHPFRAQDDDRRARPGLVRDAAQAGQRRQGHAGRRRRLPGQQQRPWRPSRSTPTVNGNDDWKAGVWNANGVPTLDAFRGVEQATVMGWFKMTGTNPSLELGHRRTPPTATTPSGWPGSCRATPTGTASGRCWS